MRKYLLLATCLFLCLLALIVTGCEAPVPEIKVFLAEDNPQTTYAVENVADLFGSVPFTRVAEEKQADLTVRLAGAGELEKVQAEGFLLATSDDRLRVVGKDAIGAMYGLFEVAEQLSFGKKIEEIAEKELSPALKNRFIKFNLPWSSYRNSPALDVHLETCRDTAFWRSFLDHMAVNRFNVLSLWNLHPFTDMVRLEKFPEASPYTAEEMEEKQQFWTSLFRMAKERGIQTYVVNWNIFVSEEFTDAHGIAGYSKTGGYWGEADNSVLIEEYTRECVRALIDEYPDLTGIGLTLGERMGGMTSPERRDWIDRTILAGMAQAKRKAKLLYRAPLSAGLSSLGTTDKSTEIITREVLDTLAIPEETVISFKYNWSHGHSSPNLFIVHGGKLTDTYWNPVPDNYSMLWTIRNEDFFTLRWGQPDFVRDFLRNNTRPGYVSGCVLGSECYLPAKDYFSKDPGAMPFTYAFERQWLWYSIWGRLLYDPGTPDELFANQLNQRFDIDFGDELLDSWKNASDYYHLFASFYKGTWDATLYAEAFSSLVRVEGIEKEGMKVVTMAAMGNRPVLDTLRFINITDYVQMPAEEVGSRMTPPELAALLRSKANTIIDDLKAYRAQAPENTALAIELTDLETLAHLQLFFAERIDATLLLAEHLVNGADLEEAKISQHLDKSIDLWQQLTDLKERYNKAVIPYVFDAALDYDKYLEVLMEERAHFQELDHFWLHELK